MDELALRDYRPGDDAALYALDLVCFEPVFRFTRRAMRAFAQAPGAVTLLIESGAVLAGFVIAHVDNDIGYIVTLDVAPAFRRHGIARRLMAEAESRILTSGATRIVLHVFEHNLAAIQFYENLGYVRTGVAANFYAHGIDALIYIKQL